MTTAEIDNLQTTGEKQHEDEACLGGTAEHLVTTCGHVSERHLTDNGDSGSRFY